LTSTAQDEWQKPGGAIETKVPLKRIGQPEDVAQAIWFLCTPAGEYISGQGGSLQVSGYDLLSLTFD
jgi:NAD(P)-dependent dehydrogenase (short-subunit alcohol dehydrogenase family)